MDENIENVDRRDDAASERHGGATLKVVAIAPPQLSELQVRLLAMISSGESLKSAAFKANVTYGNGSWHLSRARRLLGTNSIPQAAAVAMLCGFISQPTGADMRSVPLHWSRK